jgi:hypothetical protein
VHRLIARQIRRDPALVEKAKIAHARQADQFAGWPFVREWDELLSLPPNEHCVYRKLKHGSSDDEACRGWVVNE